MAVCYALTVNIYHIAFQITKNYYAEKLVEQKVRNRLEIVMVFSGKKVFIDYKTVS